nr:T9SS type A sorting domain-containing protein [Bacteroidales bacterium]
TDPTLTGASQAAPVCGSGSATINLTGMVANSTGNAIDYTINGVSQTQVTGINADGSGSASFTTASLTTGNNGQPLVITKITNGSCFTNFSQSVTLQVNPLGSWTGAVSTDWNTSGNWSCNTLPTSTTDVTIPNVTNQPVINSTGSAVCRNISIEASSSVTVNSGKDLSVYGNWSNNGQSVVGTGTVIFMGSTAQSINGATTFENLTINNANGVTLNSPTEVTGVLTPTLGALASGGNLTLVSTATQTALIAGTGAGDVTGNVTMQRYMANRMGYHYYASPFAAAPVNEFTNEIGTIISGDPYGGGTDTTQTVTPFPNFFAYDETMGPTMSIGWTGAGSTLQPLRGYCINIGASSGALTTDITGEVNNEAQTYGVTKTTTTKPGADGWNLVGNPYPSPVDWQSTGWNKAYINDAIYYFTPNSQYYGSYSSFVNGVGTGGATGIVAAMQGFFVRATGSGNLTVNNTARVNNLNPAFYKTLSNTPLLRIQGYPSQNSSYSDETVIYFDPQATGDFDGSYDAYKLMNNSPNLPNIYTSYNASPALSINGMPPLSNTDVVIPLGFLTQTNGNFTINASEILNFDPSLHIYLEDNQMSAIQDLTTNATYTFSMNANAPQYRFFIRFSPSILTGVEENGSSFVDAWASGKDIYVNYSNSSLQPAEISVYNMLGQTVISGTQEGRGTMRYTVDKPGCYIINVINTNGSYQKKVVIL